MMRIVVNRGQTDGKDSELEIWGLGVRQRGAEMLIGITRTNNPATEARFQSFVLLAE